MLAEYIKKKRLVMDMSQQQASIECDISQSDICLIENHKKDITWITIEKLAKGLGFNVLFDDEVVSRDTIGSIVKAKRLSEGITPKMLKDQKGISTSVLWQLENGYMIPYWKNLLKITDAINIKVTFVDK